jgi:mRNA interferase MazF
LSRDLKDAAREAAEEMPLAKLVITRGDVVYVDLRGAEGDEKQGKRPCLVIQNDKGNQCSPLTIVAPITDERQNKNLPVQIQVPAAELGPNGKESIIELGHIRTIDRHRRIERLVSRVSDTTMAKVDAAIKVSLGVT